MIIIIIILYFVFEFTFVCLRGLNVITNLPAVV